MLHRVGAFDKPLDNRNAINVKGRLRVKATGKKNAKRGLDPNLLNLIGGKNNVDVNFLKGLDLSKEDDEICDPMGGDP